jgi:hypothetical protein
LATGEHNTKVAGSGHVMASLRRLLRPELAVAAFSFMLPDLVDKTLWVLGVLPNGRNIGHTLFTVFLVALAFSIKKRVYGFVALCGGMAHLLSDRSALVPWFYPFKRYDFATSDWRDVLTLECLAYTLLQMALVAIVVSVAVLIILSLYSWVRGRNTQRATRASQSGGSSNTER